MKKIVGISFLLCSLGFSQATGPTTVDTKGLTAEQVQSINNIAEQLRKQPNTLANLTLQNATPDKLKEWVGAGDMAGKEVASFTKDLGIAADQFLKTDVGRITVYAIVWKLGGNHVAESFINIALKVMFAVVLYTFWWKLSRRFVFNEQKIGTVTYNEKPFLRWLGFNKKEVKYEGYDPYGGLKDDNKLAAIIVSRIVSGILLLLITLLCWPSVSF
jgi:hypothetical protein